MLASGWDVADVSFHDTVHLFEQHHVVHERWPELPDVINDIEKEMHADIKECWREVNLELA